MRNKIADQLLEYSQVLRKQVDELNFSEPTTHVYNPLGYAWNPYRKYIEKFANDPKKIVFLGMNPGPWGMAQVGVPFGEVSAVKDWLGIQESVGKPENENRKRPIQGFDCEKSEVSGRRLWGLFKDRYGDSENFFKEHFVLNYCPLVFMESTGRNRTPDKLNRSEREPLYAACDQHLREFVQLLQPEWVVGVGKFACQRAEESLVGLDVSIDWILHPSPASPAANRDWAGYASRKMNELGLWK